MWLSYYIRFFLSRNIWMNTKVEQKLYKRIQFVYIGPGHELKLGHVKKTFYVQYAYQVDDDFLNESQRGVFH